MDANQCRNALLSIGKDIPVHEINNLCPGGRCDWNSFQSALTKMIKPKADQHEIFEALKVFDKGLTG